MRVEDEIKNPTFRTVYGEKRVRNQVGELELEREINLSNSRDSAIRKLFENMHSRNKININLHLNYCE